MNNQASIKEELKFAKEKVISINSQIAELRKQLQ